MIPRQLTDCTQLPPLGPYWIRVSDLSSQNIRNTFKITQFDGAQTERLVRRGAGGE